MSEPKPMYDKNNSPKRIIISGSGMSGFERLMLGHQIARFAREDALLARQEPVVVIKVEPAPPVEPEPRLCAPSERSWERTNRGSIHRGNRDEVRRMNQLTKKGRR